MAGELRIDEGDVVLAEAREAILALLDERDFLGLQLSRANGVIDDAQMPEQGSAARVDRGRLLALSDRLLRALATPLHR